MIEGKTIIFGLGDVCCGSSLGCVTFQSIDKPLEIGACFIPKEASLKDDKIHIYLTYEEYVSLRSMMESVTSEYPTRFNFKGYIFDFSENYKNNDRSAKVAKIYLERVGKDILSTYAC